MDRDEALIEPPLAIHGDATYWDHRVDDDHYEQPGNLFRKMTAQQQQLLFENTARAMGDARIEVKQRHAANCFKADPAYGAGVATALGIDFRTQSIAAE
jgi:catalase